MSKRELGKLASVVDVDAPRAKRRREAAPQEKKPDPDLDLDATSGGAGVKREQEDPANLKQVKEQGLKLWHTVKDEVDKECVTGSCAFLRSLAAYSSSTVISPVAAHFQSIFFASPINAPTQTITP
jgi:hypothetical protein